MPARQFGAPQTTVLRPYRAVSTTAFRLWLSGTGSTEITLAADAPASSAPVSSMPSHSAVFIVISRSKSRGVRSRPSTSSEIQLYENFNLELPQESQIAAL